MTSPTPPRPEGARAGDGDRADTDRPPVVAETHISWVLLTGDRAYKIYKPVRTDVLDHREPEARRAACAREVELNARLAPDVYDGVGSITLDGSALEPVVVMRRMPAQRRLTAMLESDGADAAIRAVARRIGRFHASLPALGADEAKRVASEPALEARWAADVSGLRSLVGEQAHASVDEIERRCMAYLRGRGPLLSSRIRDGMVRDGHGDLLADDIFCLDDGPRILDCLAFHDELRWGDVLSDVGFLVMDLQRLGHAALARTLMTTYCDLTGEHHPASLAHLYVAQRALVRAKVTALRSAQVSPSSADVERLLELCIDHLRRAEVCLVLVGGLPGSGKSTLADRMAEELGWAVLASDEIRRDLGLRFRDVGGDGAYDPPTVARVYDEMRRRAGQLLGAGVPVILDATWVAADERARARALASQHHARLAELACTAPLALCRTRVSRRRGSESEATPDVVDLLAAAADPWPEATVVETEAGPVSLAPHPTAAPMWWHHPRPGQPRP